MKLYLAGPLFTAAERAFNQELRERLESLGHECWLPQEIESRDLGAESIFCQDVEGIRWADWIVASMDGPDPDSGTCWEVGYGYGLGKPCLCYRTDFRSSGDCSGITYNLMLHCSATVRLDLARQPCYELADQIDQALLVRACMERQNDPS